MRIQFALPKTEFNTFVCERDRTEFNAHSIRLLLLVWKGLLWLSWISSIFHIKNNPGLNQFKSPTLTHRLKKAKLLEIFKIKHQWHVFIYDNRVIRIFGEKGQNVTVLLRAWMLQPFRSWETSFSSRLPLKRKAIWRSGYIKFGRKNIQYH